MCPSLLLLLLSLGVYTGAENPGLKAVLTNKGLQFGTQVGTEWIQRYILNASIPSINGEVDLSLLGNVKYTLRSMGVARLNLPLPAVRFVEGTGLQVGLSGLNIAVKGRWNTSYHFIHDSGTFRLGLFGVGVSLLLQVGSDDQGHLSVSSLQCDASLGSMDILFHGGASWIFQIFLKHFRGQIQSKVQQQICPAIQRGIQGLESHLAAMNVSLQVTPDLLLDLPLTSSPAIEASDMKLDFKGEFYDVQTHKEPPFVAQPFQMPLQERYMLSVGLSEFCLNSAAFASMTAGLLQKNITDAMIPHGSPLRLNTSYFGALVPQLPKMFPNLLMELLVYASDTPMVSFLPDNATAQLSAHVKAFAIKPDSSRAPLFRLDLSANLSGKFLAKEGRIMGSLMLNNLSLALGATEVGPFQTQPLQNLLQLALTTYVMPRLNGKLKSGFQIPAVPGTQWSNTVLKVTKGFVAIATDATVSSLKTNHREVPRK